MGTKPSTLQTTTLIYRAMVDCWVRPLGIRRHDPTDRGRDMGYCHGHHNNLLLSNPVCNMGQTNTQRQSLEMQEHGLQKILCQRSQKQESTVCITHLPKSGQNTMDRGTNGHHGVHIHDG